MRRTPKLSRLPFKSAKRNQYVQLVPRFCWNYPNHIPCPDWRSLVGQSKFFDDVAFTSHLIGQLLFQYGMRKPLILLPLIGGLMTNITYILIAIFEDAIPLHMFFLTKMWEICGGMPLYYLGVCGYAATNSTKYNR